MDVVRGCQAVATEIGEDVSGTAPHAVSWLGIARWPQLPRAVMEALAETGVSAVAVRPVPTDPPASPIGMILAGTLPGRTWRRDVASDDVESALARLVGDSDVVARLAAGEDPRIGRPSRRNAVLVCADGRRDACCGRFGPDAALAVAAALAGGRRSHRAVGTDVLECSDLSGHRFAPTAVVLPWGITLGGLGPDPTALAAAVTDMLAGRPLVDGYRGRSTYPPHVQAAEAAARRHLAVVGTNAGPDDVIVHGSDLLGARVGATVGAGPTAGVEDGSVGDRSGEDGGGERHSVRMRHSGGRTIRVQVSRVRTDVTRPRSCGGDPEPVDVWDTQVEADAPTTLWFVPGN